jgi:hypothetical protein
MILAIVFEITGIGKLTRPSTLHQNLLAVEDIRLARHRMVFLILIRPGNASSNVYNNRIRQKFPFFDFHFRQFSRLNYGTFVNWFIPIIEGEQTTATQHHRNQGYLFEGSTDMDFHGRWN